MASVSTQPAPWRGEAQSPVNPDTAFNGFICTHAVHGLERLGVFTKLAADGHLDITDYCADNGLDRKVFDSLVTAAEAFGYLRRDGDRVETTENGRNVERLLGFFTWGVGGYHDVFANAAAVARGDRRFGVDLHRDEGMVALGSAQADTALMRHILDEQIAGLDFDLIADLGSGVSERVSRLVNTRPGSRGLGIDISKSATELAHDTIERYGLSDRVEPICADVLDILFNGLVVPEADKVDVVMSFMFLHDLLANPDTRDQVIPGLRDTFPNAHTFLLGDTTIRPRGENAGLPIFSTGFELAHALMNVPLHTREDYEAILAKGGMRIRDTIPFGAPHTYLFVVEAQ